MLLMKTAIPDKSIRILFLFFLVIAGLYFAKPFLVPLSIAGLLAMLFLPLAKKMEKKGLSKGLSIFGCVLMLAIVVAGIFVLLGNQVAGLTEDLPKIKEEVSSSIDKLQGFLSKQAGISSEQQKAMLEKSQGGGGESGKMVAAIMGSISGLLVDMILVFVYIFLLLYLRGQIKNFVLKIVAPESRGNAAIILSKSTEVVSKYLRGLGLMIMMLWVMYGIGFSIVGVDNAIFFAILCGLLEIIPFVGNVTGTGLTIIMAVTQGGGSTMVIGILVTYAIVQFIQTYILEPLVVGAEVNINPLFTILVIVAGEQVWGVPGMVLAIPALGIFKIICDHVEQLKPYGYLIGQEKKDDEENMMSKIKGWFKK